MASAAHAQEKPKAKERRLTNELDDVDELFQDVLNVRSLATNGSTLSCKCFLLRPSASDSAIIYENVTYACTCVDKHDDMAQGRCSLVFDKSQLSTPFPYALLTAPRQMISAPGHISPGCQHMCSTRSLGPKLHPLSGTCVLYWTLKLRLVLRVLG